MLFPTQRISHLTTVHNCVSKIRPCHGSVSWSSACHCGGPCSIWICSGQNDPTTGFSL